MQQSALWHDTIYDALGTAVQAAGGNKRVSARLWPNIDSSSAQARLRSSLNTDHVQKLDLDEFVVIARIGKESGDHSVMEYLARELGYEIKPLAAAETKKRERKARRRWHLEQAMLLDGEDEE